jgi:hypothetical protein
MTHFYRRQPPRGTKVAGNSPLGRGIGAHFLFNGNFESSVRSKPANPVVTAGPVFKSDRNGQYAVGTGAGKVTTSLYAKDLGVDGSRARTFIAEFYLSDTNVPRAVFSVGDTSGTARSQCTLEINSNYRQVRFDTFGTDLTYSPHSVTGTGARVWLAIAYDGGTTLTFRSYSKLDSTGQVILNNQVSSTGSPLATGTTFPLNLMGGGTYGFASMITELYLLSIYGGRCLTSAEIDRLYADKHQVMAPPAPVQYARLATAAAPVDTSLTGSAAAVATAWGTLSTAIPLAGAAAGAATASGALTTAIPLAGAAVAAASATGTLAGGGAALSGTATVVASGTASLSTSIRLAASGAARASGAGVLSTAIALYGAGTVEATGTGSLSVTAPATGIDISQVSPAHIAVFDGSGSRIAVFDGTGPRTAINGMTMKLPTLVNGKMTTDRDPDEISWYGADITQELADRATAPLDQSKVVPVLNGVVLLDGPLVQTATKDGITRTYVVVRLGGVDGAPPADWNWVARVPCANGERFDKTTYFNRMDT